MKLLCVEDNATQRRMIDLMLAATGIDVDFVTNGHEALEAYQLTEYDAILMDVDMPGMSGVQTAREIRLMEDGFHLAYTPILFLGRPGDAEGFDIDIDHCLIKPFTSAALFTALDRVLRAANGAGLQGVLRAMR